MKKMNNLTLAVLGYSPDLQLPCVDAPHILDLVHSFVNIETCVSTHRTEEKYVALGNMDATQTQQKHLKLKGCAQASETPNCRGYDKIVTPRETTSWVGHYSY